MDRVGPIGGDVPGRLTPVQALLQSDMMAGHADRSSPGQGRSEEGCLATGPGARPSPA
jgi:hypothetical protein